MFSLDWHPRRSLCHFLDCHLATVEGLAEKKSTPKHEFLRHCELTQDFMDFSKKHYLQQEFQYNCIPSRALSVVHQYDGSVLKWANAIRQDLGFKEIVEK